MQMQVIMQYASFHDMCYSLEWQKVMAHCKVGHLNGLVFAECKN